MQRFTPAPYLTIATIVLALACSETPTTADPECSNAGDCVDSASAADSGVGSDGALIPEVEAGTQPAAEGVAVVEFARASQESTEIGAPTIKLVVDRRGDLSGTSVVAVSTRHGEGLPAYGKGGVADVNYKAIDEQFTFGVGEATLEIPLTLLQDDLGDVDVDMFVDLKVVSGAQAGTTMSTRVTIKGSHGWLPYVSARTGLPELDVYNPPATMETMTPQKMTSATTTISGKRIDATGFKTALHANGLEAVYIENCDIYNADESLIELIDVGVVEVRNCRLRFSNRSKGSSGNRGSALWYWNSSSEHKLKSLSFLNNFIELCSGGFITPTAHPFDDKSTIASMYNFYKGVAPRSTTAANSQLTAVQGGGSWPRIDVEGNIFYQVQREDGVTYGSREDVINFFKVDGTASYPINVSANIFVGSNGPGMSGFGVLLSDQQDYSGHYYDVVLNTISCISNGGVNAYRAADTNTLGNFLYNGRPDGSFDEDREGSPNAVGLTGGAGNNYFGLNQVRYWRTREGSIQRSDQWWRDRTVPTGEETNISVEAWDDPVVGDQRFRKIRLPQMYPEPSFGDDLEWLYFSHDFPLGDAKVTYDASTHEVTLAAHGEAAGAAVDVDQPVWVDEANGKSVPAWYVTSAGGGWGLLRLRNGGANLPTANQTYTVKVTRFRPIDRVMYAGPTGKRQ